MGFNSGFKGLIYGPQYSTTEGCSSHVPKKNQSSGRSKANDLFTLSRQNEYARMYKNIINLILEGSEIDTHSVKYTFVYTNLRLNHLSLVRTLKSSATKRSWNAYVHTETKTLKISVLTDELCASLVHSQSRKVAKNTTQIIFIQYSARNTAIPRKRRE